MSIVGRGSDILVGSWQMAVSKQEKYPSNEIAKKAFIVWLI